MELSPPVLDDAKEFFDGHTATLQVSAVETDGGHVSSLQDKWACIQVSHVESIFHVGYDIESSRYTYVIFAKSRRYHVSSVLEPNELYTNLFDNPDEHSGYRTEGSSSEEEPPQAKKKGGHQQQKGKEPEKKKKK